MQPGTSLDAFDALDPDSVESNQRLIVEEVIAHGPGTSVQLAERLKRPADSVWKRCSELLAAGVLVRQGRSVNPSGREASLLAAGPHAQAWRSGIFDLAAHRRRTRAEKVARVLAAARAVTRDGKPAGDDTVKVPMPLMVELSVAFTRLDEAPE